MNVEIETCENLRDVSLQEAVQQTGKYNTIHRIVDGMSINVNTVSIQFSSQTFVASIQVRFCFHMFPHFNYVLCARIG